jgi:hypothetical protein
MWLKPGESYCCGHREVFSSSLPCSGCASQKDEEPELKAMDGEHMTMRTIDEALKEIEFTCNEVLVK